MVNNSYIWYINDGDRYINNSLLSILGIGKRSLDELFKFKLYGRFYNSYA